MLATAQSPPQPPHLLAFPAYPMSSHAPRPSYAAHPPLPAAVGRPRAPSSAVSSKGIRGFFSRARVASPEPAADPTIRARLRSIIDQKPKPKDASEAGEAGPSTRRKNRKARPASPDQTNRKIRFGPSLLPAIQKGEDGKWQPPSLSRGSMSTSALGVYAQDENSGEKRGKQSLAVLFGSRAEHRVPKNPLHSPSQEHAARPGIRTAKSEEPKQGSGFSWQHVSPPASPVKARIDDDRTVRPSPRTPRRSVEDGRPTQYRPSEASPAVSARSPAATTSKRSSEKPQPLRSPLTSPPATRSRAPTPQRPLSGSGTPRPPTSPTPTRSRASTPQHPPSASPLSRDHYLLRLATSYLNKSLTPVIRGSSFAGNEKLQAMKRLADEHISALSRMEKGWGGEWARAAGVVEQPDVVVAEGVMEAKVRALHVGERAKERERRVWVDVVKDGVLLCFLLNHLFPANPQHITRVNITRVNITEDGILRSTNLLRFQAACEAVGLGKDDVFALADLQQASENSMGRVAWTVIALARLAGKARAEVTRPLSPGNTTSPGSRSASRADGSTSPAKLRSTSREWATGISEMRRPSTETSNNLHVQLSVDTTRPLPAADDPAYQTPTASTFGPLPVTPMTADSPHRLGLARSSTQPNASPLRPRSPVESPSRTSTPIGRSLTGGTRPSLRPRHTTGSKIQVSFADIDIPSPPRTATFERGHNLHVQERTPSLISSGSRVTSGYTRTSTAFSVGTITGDDFSQAIEICDEDDGSLGPRLRERRNSERTLQSARQKLGALLSSEDLPHDLRAAEHDPDDPRLIALNQSLAALEGMRRSAADLSPRHRPTIRSAGHTARSGEVPRVAEEDEQSSAGSSILGKPSMIRRTSASGKIYVPKRAASPSPTSPSSADLQPFPSSGMLRSQSHGPPPRTSKAERRQSDGISYTATTTTSDESKDWRNSSMVNLSAMSTTPSVFRENMLRASQSLPMQVLEFAEPGFPPVKYQLGNCIGRGQFGSVYRSLNLGSGQMVAIKRIRLEGMQEKEVKDVMQEVDLLKRLAHPSIVKYEGMSRGQEYLNIVLEYVENGSLGQILKAFGKFNEKLASSYTAKILEGLDYLHSQGVVHCDLKAANILSTKTGNIKLSDFGVSLSMKAVENLQQDAATASRNNQPMKRPVSDVAGTPNWMAPEVISLNGAVFASDIWSLGCTIIELLTGKPPYADVDNSMSVLFRIVEDEMPPLPPNISDDLTDFLKLCFIKDPAYRPAAMIMFEHPWVKKLNPDLPLRPQDSVPFLRRVSMDLRRIDSTKLFVSDFATHQPDSGTTSMLDLSSDGMRRNRHSIASSHGRDGSDGTFREHNLIKTTFGKAILCRICHASVKKQAVLCQNCGLICHTACAANAPPRCDITEQLALLARQQEYLAAHPYHGLSAASSRRQSFDGDDCSGHGTPLTALPVKILSGLKRSSKSAINGDGYGERRRRSSSNMNKSAFVNDLRQSMDLRRDSNSQSRASVFSEASSDMGEDGRRRSAIRFELGRAADPPQQQTITLEEMVGAEATGRRQARGKGHRSKDSKSDCSIM